VTEAWKPIPGYVGKYEASSLGRIRSLGRLRRDGAGLDPFSTPKILKFTAQRGRPFLCLYLTRKKMKRAEAGPMVLSAFSGPRPPGLQCCHFNDDAWDNRIENLRWDTPKANCADRVRNGRQKVGEDHHSATLTAEAVRVILALRETFSGADLSRALRVSECTVNRVLRGEAWASVAS
jgi:hypothetical protein